MNTETQHTPGPWELVFDQGEMGELMAEMTREEHLAWCKSRALEYVRAGDINNAFASMASDLLKHPDTANHAGMELGAMLLMGGGTLVDHG